MKRQHILLIILAAILVTGCALAGGESAPPEQEQEETGDMSVSEPTPEPEVIIVTATPVEPAEVLAEEPAEEEAVEEEVAEEPAEESEESTAEEVEEPAEEVVEETVEEEAEEPVEEEPEVPAEPVDFTAYAGTGQELLDAWEQAYALGPNVPFNVTASEAEIEAAIERALSASGYGQNIQDIEVSFSNGQIKVTFVFQIPGTNRTASADAVFAVSVDGTGDIDVTLVSAQAAGRSVPPEILTGLTTAVEMVMTGQVEDQSGSEVYFTAVTIGGGQITISGYVVP
ncbi:MAG: hypothetical protein JXJ17_17210 [Anaerolineae bacterium]|nr:hypothetical protein [Anaerolineae bacterium]